MLIAFVFEVGHAVEGCFERIVLIPVLVGHSYPSAVVPSVPAEPPLEKPVVAPVAAVFGGFGGGQPRRGKAILHGVEQRRIARVVEVGAEHDAYALTVESVDKLAQLFDGTVVFVGLGVVERIISVVAVVGEIVDSAAARHPAVDLFVDVGHPDHVDAQTAEIAFAGLGEHPFEVAAVKSGGVHALRPVVGLAAVVDIVQRVAVTETVGYDEIDCSLFPVEAVGGRGEEMQRENQKRKECKQMFHGRIDCSPQR